MIAVIADDFTGAAELGAIGLRHGLRSEVIELAGLEALAQSDAELVCVDTGTRNCRPSEAARRAARAARTLRNRGIRRIYKKVDSVLRGPVAAEIEAVCRTLGLRRALLVPANPSAGRVIAGGIYRIGDMPLDQTDFRFDPRHPRRTALVAALLRARGGVPIEIRSRSAAAADLPARGIIVGEASRPGDIRHWAGLLDEVTLPAGAAEFFGGWLKTLGFRRVPGMADTLPQGRELFVCGSASAATREFVQAARRAGVVVRRLRANELRSGAVREFAACLRRSAKVLNQRGRLLLAVPASTVREPAQARRLVGRLVRLAAALVRHTGVERVFAEGGETAAALARALGWRRLSVVAELAPGVVGLSPGNDRTGVLVVKPGSYRWPATILSVVGPAND